MSSGSKGGPKLGRRMSIEENSQEILGRLRSQQDLHRLGSVKSGTSAEIKAKPNSVWWGLDQTPISTKEEIWKDGVSEIKDSSDKEDVGRFMIHPQSNFRVIWDSITLILLGYFVFAVPLRLCFVDTQTRGAEECVRSGGEAECKEMRGCVWESSRGACDAEEANAVMFWVDTLIDLFFLYDIVLNFRTCYFVSGERGTQRLITSKRQIAFRYIRSFFIFDLAGSIPVDAILYFAQASGSSNNLIARLPKVLRIAKIARLLKLIRAARIGKIIDTLQETFSIKPGVFRVWKFAFVFVTVAHLMACCLFASGTPKSQFVCVNEGGSLCDEHKVEAGLSTTWISETYIMSAVKGEIAVEDADLDVQYTMSIYWAFTIMTTVGFGDIQPATTIEVLTCILCMLVGASTFSYVVGNMADLADKAGGESAAHKAKMDQAMSFMQEHNVPKSLKMRVRRYYDFVHNNPQVDLTANHFKELSPILKNELLASFRIRDMSNTTIFQALDPVERETFLNSLLGKLEPVTLCPGDVIFHQGEIGRNIVIIVEGEIDFLSPQSTEPFATFDRGNFLGENILIPGQERRPFTAKSRSFSNVLLLSFKHLHATFQDFPGAESRVRLAARIRWARIMKAYECHRILTKYKQKSSQVTGKMLFYLLARVHKDALAEQENEEREVVEYEDWSRKLTKVEHYIYREISEHVTQDNLGKELVKLIAEICFNSAEDGQKEFDWSSDWVDSPDIPDLTYKLGMENRGSRLAEHKAETNLGQKQSAILHFDRLAIREIDSEAENVKSGVDLEIVLNRIVHRLDLVEAQSRMFDDTIALSEHHLFKPPAPKLKLQDLGFLTRGSQVLQSPKKTLEGSDLEGKRLPSGGSTLRSLGSVVRSPSMQLISSKKKTAQAPPSAESPQGSVESGAKAKTPPGSEEAVSPTGHQLLSPSGSQNRSRSDSLDEDVFRFGLNQNTSEEEPKGAGQS